VVVETQLTPRRPHRPLKRFTFQRDTAFQLALWLTMRRILATLAVVGALLFSAGSAWADFDDDSGANKLFVEAVKLVKSAEGEKSFEKTLSVIEEALARLNKIIDDYPSSDLAAKLISGQSVGGISLEDVGEAAVRARIMYYEGGSFPENYAEQFMRMLKVLGAK
jgi:hypothetical protein